MVASEQPRASAHSLHVRSLASGLLIALAILIILGACRRPARVVPPPEPRFENLIVVMIDTLRSDHLPSYGYHRDTAPFLSRLAAEGIQLQGYAASSWTRSSVATLLTGLHPQRHQTVGRDDALPGDAPFLAPFLAERGYSTVALVTNGNVSAQFGFDRGYSHFQELLSPGKPDTARAREASLKLLLQLEPPFFFYLHLIDPHDPYIPSVPWERPDVPPSDYIQPQHVLRDEAPMNAASISLMVDQYDSEIREMDRDLAALFDDLRAAGSLDDTLVVITSDHGEEFGEHDWLAHGATLFEEVLEVPFILWSDGELASYSSGAVFHHVDFFPTVLTALGFSQPPGLDGIDRWRDIEGQRPPPTRELLFHLSLDKHDAVAIREDNLKLIERNRAPSPLLFDLAVDPEESNPLDPQHSQGRRLASRLRRQNAELTARSFKSSVAEAAGKVRDQLEALGYLKGGKDTDRGGSQP